MTENSWGEIEFAIITPTERQKEKGKRQDGGQFQTEQRKTRGSRKGAKKATKIKNGSTPLRLCAFARDSFIIDTQQHLKLHHYSCYLFPAFTFSPFPFILGIVSELDEAWALALAEAERRARTAGRGDIADYIALRASNDLMRSTGIEWLMNALTTLAGEANRAGASIRIEKADGHSFRVGSATMVGPRLTFRMGVRTLTAEAGWPRTPRDGFVRGGGLACGRINHFGKRSADEELMLVRSQSGAPEWYILEQTGKRNQLLEARLRQHLSIFLKE
jgi:hypothetical protein